MQDSANMIDRMNDVISGLQAELATLKTKDGHHEEKRHLIDDTPISQVPYFVGDKKGFTDFEFKLHHGVDPYPRFEKAPDWIKELEFEPTLQVVNDRHAAENFDGLGEGVDRLDLCRVA